jgi:hypothetical protein
MPHGHEDKLAREAMARYVHRKAGINIIPRVAIGQDYASIARIESLHTMPDGVPLEVQDSAGNLVFLPGHDAWVNN